MFLIISFFSISLLHVRRRLPYIINDDSEVTSEQLSQWDTNPGSAEKLLTYAVYLVLYLDLWVKKCCIVVCIVTANTILVVQSRIDRSSHRRCSIKMVLLQISQYSRRKHLRQSLFFNKVTDLMPTTLWKKRL